MLNLAPEILQLNREGLISDDAAGPLVVQERREVVSLYAEVRTLAWLGVMMIAGGIGVIVSKNIDRIGPVAIAVAIGLASAACYAYAIRRRRSAHHGLLDEYVLLLGALILSADVGYIEHQFHLLGPEWPRHFLLLAIVHGATAYYFDSAALLSMSIAALASWFGIERNVDTFFTDQASTAMRAFTCAAVVGVWRVVNRRPGFTRVFDHFALNLGLWGGLILTFNDDWRYLGTLIVLVLAAVAVAYGWRVRAESFAMYAIVYATIAVDVAVLSAIRDFYMFWLVVSSAAAIAALFLVHELYARR